MYIDIDLSCAPFGSLAMQLPGKVEMAKHRHCCMLSESLTPHFWLQSFNSGGEGKHAVPIVLRGCCGLKDRNLESIIWRERERGRERERERERADIKSRPV